MTKKPVGLKNFALC